ncbi:MAG TPA: oxygenase MpaB family protein [Kofleriaceae bacterium]|nr:oxygenase MpaB family protein [Kofleriaceae bacterium]
MIVSRADLEARLLELRALVRDPAEGIHGPGSHAWELKRESINFAGGARAALLQLAHPFVAHAIDQHSSTRTDIQGRFQRTFTNVFAMTFGDLDEAFRAARRVHNVHTRIHGLITEDVGAFARGTPYHANDVAALTWVWATLMDTILVVQERFVRRRSEPFKARFYQESKKFALLFGIPDSELPADYPAFRRYVDGMLASDTLTVGGPGLEMSRFLLAPTRPSLGPLFSWYRVITAGLLPARLRQQFQLPWERSDRAVYRASVTALRGLYRATPRALRYLPAYVQARRRLAGSEPGRFDGVAYKLAMRTAALRPR